MNCGTPVDASPAPAPVPESRPQVKASPEFGVTQPDKNTLTFNILGVPFNMKFIKGGMMGNVQISDCDLGETVVTQALWQTVTGSNPSEDISDLQFPVTDFDSLFNLAPQCHTVVTTGQKATETLASHSKLPLPKVGQSVDFSFHVRPMRLFRMPSTSRAYPMALEKKAEIYSKLLKIED